MNRQLVDANVPLALLWPRHEGHVAHSWFAKSGNRAWATNPLVEVGVLRLLTNPSVTQGTVSSASALWVLSEITSQSGHQFWPLDRPVALFLKTLAGRLKGHRQWPDAWLLAQAAAHDGVLVTFDTGVKELAAGELTRHVQILKPG